MLARVDLMKGDVPVKVHLFIGQRAGRGCRPRLLRWVATSPAEAERVARGWRRGGMQVWVLSVEIPSPGQVARGEIPATEGGSQ